MKKLVLVLSLIFVALCIVACLRKNSAPTDPTDPAKRQFPQLCVGSVVRRDAAISFIRIGSFLFRTLAVTADQLVQGF